MNLVMGGTGLLGNAIIRRLPNHSCYVPSRAEFDLKDEPQSWEFFDYSTHVPEVRKCEVAYLCAGTKGFQECEGDRGIFHADVDGNIRLIRSLLKADVFVVFVSTDAVEFLANTSYARNRLLVEQALWMKDGCAVVRPSRFNEHTVSAFAEFCVDIGENKKEGVHCWKP